MTNGRIASILKLVEKQERIKQYLMSGANGETRVSKTSIELSLYGRGRLARICDSSHSVGGFRIPFSNNVSKLCSYVLCCRES